MSIIYDYNRSVEILEQVYLRFPELKNFSIPIVFTDEIPFRLSEIIKTTNEKNYKEVKIFKLLGEYLPQENIIKIYLQGFRFAFQYSLINEQTIRDYQILMKIVILHEIGHYWFYNFHGLNSSDVSELIDFSRDNNYHHKYIHEWAAQAFSYLCLTDEEEKKYMKSFAKDRQPEEYQTFIDDVENSVDIDAFRTMCILLHTKKIYSFFKGLDFLTINGEQINANRYKGEFTVQPLIDKFERYLLFCNKASEINDFNTSNIINSEFYKSVDIYVAARTYQI